MTAFLRFGLGFLLVIAALVLIALVLIQRGRGGGLAGAFGGMGGQSAFGTKAGDVFTRITVIVATCWILLCILAINMLGRSQSLFSPSLGGSAGQAVPSRTPADDATAQPPAATDSSGLPPAAATTVPGAEQSGDTANQASGEASTTLPATTLPATALPATATPAAPAATAEPAPAGAQAPAVADPTAAGSPPPQ